MEEKIAFYKGKKSYVYWSWIGGFVPIELKKHKHKELEYTSSVCLKCYMQDKSLARLDNINKYL